MNNVVSIIITTRNEGKNIRLCLDSIKKQTYKDIEIIVVDNNSSDDTKNIARSYTEKVFDKGPERSTQRNFGASAAAGRYILFLDADMELTPRVIQECVDVAEQGKKPGVVIPEESFGIGFWAKCKALERSFYLGVDWIEAARFFRKDTFMKVGGYDEILTGPEDFDLPQRMKERYGQSSVGRIRSFIRHNEGRLTFGRTISKKYYYGKKMQRYKTKQQNKKYVGKQASLLNRYVLFLSKPQKLFRNPIVGLGMLFMKTSEMAALGLGYLSGILQGAN